LSPTIAEYNTAQGRPPFPPFLTVTESFTFPLTYQPGTSWQYSSGIDWAGLLISRVAGMSLEEYTQKNIASPLGIDDMTYFLAGKPDLQSRLVSIVNRDPSIPDGKGKVVASEGPGFLSQVKEELGGAGLHTSAHSYIKILHSLLANDEKLLKRETVDSMFEPQLTPASQQALQATFDHIPRGETGSAPPFIGEFAQVQHDFGLGGMLSMEDVDSGSKKWRRKGYMFWSGMANWYWVSCIHILCLLSTRLTRI
jgi:CubicO group peptidase (beta-lactamase class C family)